MIIELEPKSLCDFIFRFKISNTLDDDDNEYFIWHLLCARHFTKYFIWTVYLILQQPCEAGSILALFYR